MSHAQQRMMRRHSLLHVQGASASHPVDGDLTTLVDACSPGHRVSVHGLAACSIDISTVGNYTASFFLSDASLTVSSNVVSRTVVVHPACIAPEVLCSDNKCSTGGFCFDGTPTQQEANSPPEISFIRGQLQSVYVPRGVPYMFCNATSEDASTTLLGALCEAGPTASDPEDGDITHRVLACPPALCLQRGCPGHELQGKGLAGCGVDTVNAPVGTVFNITFTVFDTHRPSSSASIFRLVHVMSPCAQAQVYCPDSAVQCADAPCSLRDAMQDAAADAVLPPPEFSLDLSTVAKDSVQLVNDGTASPALHIWGLCGRSLPVDFTNICFKSSSANKPSGGSWSSQICPRVQDPCTVSVLQEGGVEESAPTVIIVREEEEQACAAEAAGACVASDCSLAALANGRCTSPHQVYTLYALDSDDSGTASSELNQIRVEVQILGVVASATVAMRTTVSASSSQHAEHMHPLAEQAIGSSKCSAAAAAVHRFLLQHVQTTSACSTLASEAALISGSNHITIDVEITEAQSTGLSVAADESAVSGQNFTAVGILELQTMLRIGVDLGSLSSSHTSNSSVHTAAASCLDTLQGSTLVHQAPSGEQGSLPGVALSLTDQAETGDQPSLFFTSIELTSVTSQEVKCQEVSAEIKSVDEMAAVVENAEMEQSLNERNAEVDWNMPEEITYEERTNDGEIICELATSATTSQSDRDIMLDQLVVMLSAAGSEDVYIRLPQNCKELVNGAVLQAENDDSESSKLLGELSGGQSDLNVTSTTSLQLGAQRNQAIPQRRGLKQQQELSPVTRTKLSELTGWHPGMQSVLCSMLPFQSWLNLICYSSA